MEMQKLKDSRLFAIIALYDMHTSFLEKALKDISDEDAHNRMNTKANHIAWLTGSLIEQRFEMAHLLGFTGRQQKAHELFRQNKGIQDGVQYPTLASYLEDWNYISPVLRDALMQADDVQLSRPFDMGTESFPMFDMITFTTYREANCIGQLALWRRLLGYQPMNYM